MSSVKAALSANRVAAIGSFAVAVGSLVAAFIGVFPNGWQNTVLAISGLLQHAPVLVTYLRGAQKWDALQAAAGHAQGLSPGRRLIAPASAGGELGDTPSPLEQALGDVDHSYSPEFAGAPSPEGAFPDEVAPTPTAGGAS